MTLYDLEPLLYAIWRSQLRRVDYVRYDRPVLSAAKI